MENGVRERVVLNGEHFLEINNTQLKFSRGDHIQLLEQQPEKFSPNVVIRPLYERVHFTPTWPILEAGWASLLAGEKDTIWAFRYFFPVLVRRDSMLWISNAQCQTLNKHDMAWQDLFLEESLLVDKYIHKTTSFDISLEEEAGSIAHIFSIDSIQSGRCWQNPCFLCRGRKGKSDKIGWAHRTKNKRAIKKNEETAINQLTNLKTNFSRRWSSGKARQFYAVLSNPGSKFFLIP